MFASYAQHGPTTLVVPGIPELIVALAQLPIYGWFLARAVRKGVVKKTTMKIMGWHILAIIAAILLSEFLHYVWWYHPPS